MPQAGKPPPAHSQAEVIEEEEEPCRDEQICYKKISFAGASMT